MPELVPPPAPNKNKWVPKQKTPLWAALIVGMIPATAAPLMLAVPHPWNLVVGGALGSVAITLATYFGMKSAGTR